MMSSERDISIAVLGASAALAAVLLVFVALLFARADSIPSEVPDSVVKRYRTAAMWGLLPVAVCGIVMLASYESLFCPGLGALRLTWRWGFWVETVTFLGYACGSVWLLGRT
jgi:hypothetical protein